MSAAEATVSRALSDCFKGQGPRYKTRTRGGASALAGPARARFGPLLLALFIFPFQPELENF
jgi:hypothetical protein